MTNKISVHDDGGFYALPERLLELIGLAFPHFTSLERRLVKGLIDQGTPIRYEDLNFLSTARASEILACIELGRRAWCKPTEKGTIIESAHPAYLIFSEMLRGKTEEHFAVIFLDVKHKVIGRQVVSIGTEVATLVPVKKILRLAIVNSQNIIVGHNHPSGSLEPSSEDITLTARLIEACQLVDITLIDHLIITDQGFASIRQINDELWS
jgi:DNA repair protein RadC